jgi:hypothetical protein
MDMYIFYFHAQRGGKKHFGPLRGALVVPVPTGTVKYTYYKPNYYWLTIQKPIFLCLIQNLKAVLR